MISAGDNAPNTRQTSADLRWYECWGDSDLRRDRALAQALEHEGRGYDFQQVGTQLQSDSDLAKALEVADWAGKVPMRQRFKSSQIDKCFICLEDGIDACTGISLTNCKHEFCIDCMASYVKSKHGGQKFMCPHPLCGATIDISDIRYTLIENGDKDAWSTFQEQATLSFIELKVAGDEASLGAYNKGQSQKDFISRVFGWFKRRQKVERGGDYLQGEDDNEVVRSVYRRCPAEHCNYIFEHTPSFGSGYNFECPIPSCQSKFCLDCVANGGQVGPPHPGQSCNDRLKHMKRFKSEKQKLESWKRENAKADKRFRDLVRKERFQRKSKRCPQCHELVTKNGGCDHMSCRCGHHFQWKKAK